MFQGIIDALYYLSLFHGFTHQLTLVKPVQLATLAEVVVSDGGVVYDACGIELALDRGQLPARLV